MTTSITDDENNLNLNLNLPPTSPQVHPTGVVNLKNWKNWLAALLALLLVLVAFPFTQQRTKSGDISFYGYIIKVKKN